MVNFTREARSMGREDDGERTSGSNKMLRVHGGYKKSYDFFPLLSDVFPRVSM